MLMDAHLLVFLPTSFSMFISPNVYLKPMNILLNALCPKSFVYIPKVIPKSKVLYVPLENFFMSQFSFPILDLSLPPKHNPREGPASMPMMLLK